MAGDRIKVAELTDAQVQKLHALEQETGKLLVAYEPRHSFAELTPVAAPAFAAID